MEALARALEDGYERIPPKSAGPKFTENHGRTDGAVLLWRGSEVAGRLCGAESEELILAGGEALRRRVLDGEARRQIES